jgi:asparagine synthase (glutamine-hydrolysing)
LRTWAAKGLPTPAVTDRLVLLAAVGAADRGWLRALRKRAEDTWGPATSAIECEGGLLLAWGPCCRADAAGRWIGEGRVVLEEGSYADAFGRIASAAGDFALLGLAGQGPGSESITLASGAAGGYHPLYVAAGDGSVVASTRFGAVAALMRSTPVLDEDVLAAIVSAPLLFRFPSDLTVYRNVLRLPMHEAWRVRPDGSVLRISTFRPLAACDDVDVLDPVAELRDAFRASVRRATSETSRVGVMLSGGLDSSSLLATAVDLAKYGEAAARPDVFTWDYATAFGDDRPYWKAMARAVDLEPEKTTERDAAASLDDAFVQDGMPFPAPAGPFFVAFGARVRALGTRVVVTGVGGDDVLDGDPRWLVDLARAGHPWRAAIAAARLRGFGAATARARLWAYLLRPLLRGLVPVAPGVTTRRRLKGHLRRFPWAGPRLKRHLARLAEASVTPRPTLRSSASERFEALARLPYIRQNCVVRGQMEAITGCPWRDPFFDEEFLRVVARIPPLELMRGDLRRGLLREAMRGLVPDEVRLRRTKSIIEPAFRRTVEAGGGFERLAPLARVERLADLGLVEPARYRQAFDDLARSAEPHSGWINLWPCLAAEAWLRTRETGLATFSSSAS